MILREAVDFTGKLTILCLVTGFVGVYPLLNLFERDSRPELPLCEVVCLFPDQNLNLEMTIL